MKIAQKIALAITIIGGINWGLVGLFNFNLVDTIFNFNNVIPRVIYSLVGITSLFNIILFFMDLNFHD